MRTSLPVVDWVNHASYQFNIGGVRLWVDPWVGGRVFDDGWDLVSPSVSDPSDMAAFSHIWLSHEHPDHFNPRTLKAIPPVVRESTEVLYQRTKDDRVAAFCKSLGFKLRELESGKWIKLAPGVEAACVKWSGGDSCLALRGAGWSVLNLNDCIVRDEADARRVLAALEMLDVDVLLTQFSYANWVGNPSEGAWRRREAEERLCRIGAQTRALGAKYVIPFASFVWFCHEENYWLNDEANTVRRAAEFIRTETRATPVVLYPGESWVICEEHDSSEAIERYDADRSQALRGPRVQPAPSVPISELSALATEFWTRLENANGHRTLRVLEALGVLGSVKAWLPDLEQRIALSRDVALVAVDGERVGSDVALSSSALAFCLRHEYGGSTLFVNGRFQVPPGGSFERFRRLGRIANMNSRGENIKSAVPELVQRAAHGARRYAVRVTGSGQ